MSDRVEVLAFRDREAEIRVDGKVVLVPFINDGARVHFVYDGDAYSVEIGGKGGRTRARHRDHSMAAPMPGMVLKILVKPGDVVTKGTPLVVLEAMKMEHQILATRDGTVTAVNCLEGDLVQAGLDLVELT